MKYIGNAFSINMIDEGEIKITNISKQDFINAGKTATSIVGHPEIAELFNLKLNRTSIYLTKGDVLFVVSPKIRPMENQKVESGTKYEFVPENMGYVYKKVEVL